MAKTATQRLVNYIVGLIHWCPKAPIKIVKDILKLNYKFEDDFESLGKIILKLFSRKLFQVFNGGVIQPITYFFFPLRMKF